MSGVAIVRGLLATNLALITYIPATKIFSGAIPLNTELPAIAVAQVSGNQHNNVGMNSAEYLATDRVQVTVLAKTYPLQKSYIKLIRAALPNAHGMINGFNTDSIIPDSEGPDFYDDTAIIYEQSIDFMVKFAR